MVCRGREWPDPVLCDPVSRASLPDPLAGRSVGGGGGWFISGAFRPDGPGVDALGVGWAFAFLFSFSFP